MATITGTFLLVPASNISTQNSVSGATYNYQAVAQVDDNSYIYHSTKQTTKWDKYGVGLASGSTLPPSTYTITNVVIHHRARKSDSTSLTTSTTSHTKLSYNGSQIKDGSEHKLENGWNDYTDSVAVNYYTKGVPNFEVQIGLYRGNSIIHSDYQARCSRLYLEVSYTYETYDLSYIKSLGCTGSNLQINYPTGAAGPDESHDYGNENWVKAIPQDANITVTSYINDTYYDWLGYNKSGSTYETTSRSITKNTILSATTITAYDYLNHIFVGNKHPKIYIGGTRAGKIYRGTNLIHDYTGS